MHEPERMRRWRPPRPRRRDVARLTVIWAAHLALYIAQRSWMVLTRTYTRRAAGSAVRARFQQLGPAGRLVGRQLGKRLDLFGLELASELARTRTDAEPVPVGVLLARLGEVVDGPVDAVFAAIDPEPLGSTAMACTWLAELADGRQVTIRLRRPGLVPELAAAAQTAGNVSRAAELLGLLQPGLAADVRDDLDHLVSEAADFVWIGRLQELHRRRLERDGVPGVFGKRVLTAWLRDDLLVAEYVEGVDVHAVVGAVERRDTAALADLRALGITPEDLAVRVLQLGWWELFEAMFFTAAPDANRLIVAPDGRLCIVAYEDCDILPRRQRRLIRDAWVLLSEDDVSGAADALVRALAPIPHVDVHALTRGLEGRLAEALHRTRNPGAPWVSRTSLGLWMALLELTAVHGVPLRLGLVRALRAEMESTLLAGRLWPELDLWAAFDAYRAEAQGRILAHARRRAKLQRRIRDEDRRALGQLRLRAIGRRLLQVGQDQVDTARVTMRALQSKGAHALVVVLNTLVGLGLFTAVLVGASALVTRAALADALVAVVSHPGWIAPVLVVVVMAMRVVLFRLDDLDRGGG